MTGLPVRGAAGGREPHIQTGSGASTIGTGRRDISIPPAAFVQMVGARAQSSHAWHGLRCVNGWSGHSLGCVRSRNATFPYYGPLMGFGPGFVLRCDEPAVVRRVILRAQSQAGLHADRPRPTEQRKSLCQSSWKPWHRYHSGWGTVATRGRRLSPLHDSASSCSTKL